MAKKSWLKELRKSEFAIVGDYDPHAHTLNTPSPSFNSIFGNTWGLPQGFTMALFGPPKGGKSVTSNAMIGQLHRDDPDAIAVKYDTELRERGQLTPAQKAIWGIDPERYQCYGNNEAAWIFDDIEHRLAGLCQEGMPLKLVIIDSITGTRGRNDMNRDSVNDQLRADQAQTVQEGLKRILMVQRQHNFGLILCTHVRAEQDPNEIKKGNKYSMPGGWAMKHHAEYFVFVERLRIKDSNKDLLGNEFTTSAVKDAAGNDEVTGHKIRATMKDNSFGCEGRQAIFTFDHKKGIVSQHEEAFLLGVGRGVIERPNQGWYAFGNKKWNGKPATLAAMKGDPDLCKAIVSQVRQADIDGKYALTEGTAGIALDELNVPDEA